MGNSFVRKLSLAGALSTEDIAALEAAVSKSRELPKRRDLIREGDRPGPMFVVLEGWACRYKILPNGTRQIMAFMMPGDACDLHISSIAQMDHSIQTITPARVATIAPEVLDAMLSDHPRIARAMYVSQLIDEGTLRAWIVSMGRRNSAERVAHLMCELWIRSRNIGLSEAESLVMPFSQAILADALGMTPVHVNRILKQLRAAGAMDIQRGSMKIAEPDKLVRIAGFDDGYLHRRIRPAA